MSKNTIISNPITNYKWIWDKNKNPLDFGFRKLTTSENEYTKTYSLWKYHGHTTIYAIFTVDEDNQINIDVYAENGNTYGYAENGNTYGLFYHSINEPIIQEFLNKLLKILKILNAHTVTSKGEKNE